MTGPYEIGRGPTPTTSIGDPAATMYWLQDLRTRPVSKAIPLLLARLDAIARSHLDTADLLHLLRLLKRPVLKATAALPSPDPRLADAGLPGLNGPTMEQRLDRAMYANLKRLFYDIDRRRFHAAIATEGNRLWALRNLFKFLRRQVRYALLARRETPEGLWQDAHDLFVYLVLRGRVRVADSLTVDFLEDGFKPEIEYKRLLLMGWAAQCDLHGEAIIGLIGHLTEWAYHTRLADPGVYPGVSGLLLVEVAWDRPVRMATSAFDSTFRGWVLQPPKQFLHYCAHHGRQPLPLALESPLQRQWRG